MCPVFHTPGSAPALAALCFQFLCCTLTTTSLSFLIPGTFTTPKLSLNCILPAEGHENLNLVSCSCSNKQTTGSNNSAF